MIMISRVLKKGAACVMTMMIIISNDSDNDNDIMGSGVKRLVCTGEASGRSPSQYVDVICLEFLPGGQDVIFIVLIVIPADPPLPSLAGAGISGNVRCKGPCLPPGVI